MNKYGFELDETTPYTLPAPVEPMCVSDEWIDPDKAMESIDRFFQAGVETEARKVKYRIKKPLRKPVQSRKAVQAPKTKPKVYKLAKKPVVASRTDRVGVRGFDGVPERITWLWEGMIPLGEVTILAGPKETCKTQFLLDLVAKVSRGELPGEFFGTPVESLVFCLEDSESRVTKPRLMAAGWNEPMVHAPKKEDFPEDFYLSERLDSLRKTLENNPNIKLVAIDTLSSVMTAKERSYDGIAVRRLISALRSIVDEFKVALVGTAHVVKTVRADPNAQILGSVENINGARSILRTAKFDRDDYGDAVCVLTQTGNNLGPKRKNSIVYRSIDVKNVTLDSEGKPVHVHRVEILNENEPRGVYQICEEQASAPTRNREPSPCIGWLKEYLTEPKPVTQILEDASDRGFSRRTVYRAHDSLKVISSEGKTHKEKVWSLPTNEGK